MQTSAARLGLQVPVYDDDPNQLMASSLSEYFIAPYAGRRPFCAGPLPTWDLPLPYSHLHYPDLQALCAVAPLGGSPHGSAGFTCVRRPNSLAEEPFELVYFDEWTPHALTNSNWPTGLAVRLYCAAYCACNERQLADRSRQALQNVRVSWLAGGVWVTLLDGGVQLILPGGAVVAIVGEGAVAGPPPPGLIAMRPWWLKNQASVEEIRESQSIDSGVCGSSCRSNQDCGSGATACSRCMVSINKQQPDGSRMRGMDIFLGAACTIVGLGLREKRLGSGGTRGKRDLRKTDEVCACNATYVSRACCDSADGMLWEDTRLKLGALTVAETSEVRDDEDAFDLVQ
ncbi:MAG: hypothetical protein M1814_003783 [Vezdaea aestivalis]|nr:MAG: hypothetical protein M1814_003783 [Vezdaea aestivalis]